MGVIIDRPRDSIIIEDISEELPRHPHKRWPKRTSTSKSLTVHHTGGSTRLKGRSAPVATASFCVRANDPATSGLEGRGWPGIPYHYFIPFEPEVRNGKIVVYRCQPNGALTNHAGPWNNESIGIALQGTFDARLFAGRQPSDEQRTALFGLFDWLEGMLGIDCWERWPHAWRGKPSCPGATVVSWLVFARELTSGLESDEEIAQALACACDAKPSPLDDAGFVLRRLVERFQRSQSVIDIHGMPHPALLVDGIFGAATETMLRRVFAENGWVI